MFAAYPGIMGAMSRPANTTRVARRVRAELRERGWLLQADAALPSVASLVAGEPIRGSWWAHPRSNLVYWVLEELEDSSDVLCVKLVRGKATLLHRALWPALVAIGCSRQRWQTAGLSRAARSLLARTQRAESLRLDRLERWSGPAKPGDAARELEARLLVYAREIHTETGRHTKQLETWSRFAARLRLDAPLPDPDAARRALERAVAGEKWLPWQ
jgi:hypothetical protein